MAALLKSSSLILSLLFFLITGPLSEAQLTPDYYKKTCPNFDNIIRETITSKQLATPSTAAATIRMFFHDCFVEGCDASVLISSNAFSKAERDEDINLSLPGDAYDVITRAKIALELSCPKTVSCADILAQATRDLVTMVGGPYYTVPLGRKDGLVSEASRIGDNIPKVNMTMDQIIESFTSKGFTIEEMVALTGAHTIGFSHCKEFSDRIFNHSPASEIDPTINPQFATGLRTLCANFTADPTMAAFNDPMTPGKFDNMYFQNLAKGLGLLKSDHLMYEDPRTRPYVELYARDQAAFFKAFADAMEKLSVYGVKTGLDGEVRNRCDAYNDWTH